MYNDGVEVIDICHEDVLHVLEGSDGEGPGEVSVHCACVGVGGAVKQNIS